MGCLGRCVAVGFWLGAVACSSEGTTHPVPPTATGVGTTTTTSATETGTASGAGTVTGGVGGQGGEGGGGPVGGGCPDTYLGEPNETESTAYWLSADPIDDCDGSGDHVSGVLSGADDVDWFVYPGNDALWPVCIVNPTRELDASEADLRLCVFFQCLAGETQLSCPGGTTAVTSPEARPGCCSNDGFEVNSIGCGGTFDDDTYVFIRVDQPGATAATCSEYVVTYHY